MILHNLGHAIINFFGGHEPDKWQNAQIDNAILDAETQILLNALTMYGHEELQHIAANLDRIKNEMQKRGLSELKLSGQYVIKLNTGRMQIIKL